MNVLIDTNVILDVLQQREPWFGSASQLFLAAAVNQMSGFVTAKQVADIYFFASKQLKGMPDKDEKARKVVAGILELFGVIDTLEIDCRTAFGIDNNDYEDAIMIASAARTGMDCVVTRNMEHFMVSTVQVVTPDELLDMLSPTEE